MKKGRIYAILKAPSTKHQAPSTKHQAPSTKHQAPSTKHKLGFTLSELMIGLGILGLISSITMPSIINAVDSGKRKALFKETVNTIATVVQKGVLEGELTPDEAGETWMLEHINAAKTCPTGACEGGWLYHPFYRYNVREAILHNEVKLGICHWGADYQMVYVKLPGNKEQDLIYVCYNATEDTTNGACGTLKSGMVGPHRTYPDMVKRYYDLLELS
ncbi:MAG: prepilin-type N-terminal cleavage/methylation domain-containing protein [Candidatus Melainabacteria bacterium]|nr:prepilin-type N-terminal cleavage/methylation domain-containing protein [Candidatus Melainabacteria bacterium]